MSNKLQELTERLYQEGLSKGKEEGEQLLARAREEAGRIVEEARRQAAGIVADAQKQAAYTMPGRAMLRRSVSVWLSRTRTREPRPMMTEPTSVSVTSSPISVFPTVVAL